MAGILLVAFLSIAFGTIEGASGSSWSYGESDGPGHWESAYPNCGLTRQSPINLPNSQDMVYNSDLKPFMLKGFKNPQDYKLEILNNGHTVQVNVEEGDLTVEGGGLPGRFKTAQFHFHWGSDNMRGSEHLSDGSSYPMELHVVNYNEKYGSLSNAASKERDGLAVLGFFFVISDEENSGLRTMLNKFNDVKTKGAMTELTSFSIESMLPLAVGNPDHFYRYSGSLTTPPCYESVVWTIFENAISISEQQMAMFRKLLEDNLTNGTHVIVNNFRPVQPLGERRVMRSFELNSASNIHLSSIALFLFLVCFI